MDRRCFLRGCLLGTAGLGLGAGGLVRADAEIPREARYYQRLDGGQVRCALCPHGCIIQPGRRGICRVRENRKGSLFSLVHSRACAVHVDPIEKKPLYHFRPGTMSYSLATPGCNFVCLFCQNWQISQAAPETVRLRELPPDRVVSEAGAAGCPSIAFTYTEPVVATEFVLDTARAARDSGIATVAISNGFYQESPLRELCRYLAAVKVDLKAFQDEFYRRCCAGRLAPVLRSLEIIREEDTWLELVVLLLPGLNDSPGEIRAMSRWVVQHLGPDVPLHFSRFHPAYRMKDLPPTPRETVIQARRIARQEGVRYAYVGNIPGQEGESTDCHQCSQPLIRRTGFLVRENRLARGKCPACGTVIPGVWS